MHTCFLFFLVIDFKIFYGRFFFFLVPWSKSVPQPRRSISVMIGLVWSELGQSEVLGLIFGKGGDADSQVVQMGLGDLLVQLLGQHVDTDLVLATLGPEFDLGQNLVGEGVAHDEGRMSHGASQINETAFGEEDDVLSVFEGVTVDLGLHVILDGVGVEPGGIDLAIEMSDVADDGILQHHLEVRPSMMPEQPVVVTKMRASLAASS